MGIEFNTCSFENYNPNDFKNCLFYLDPPYYNTKEYENKFDYEKFYNWCEELGKENYVFIEIRQEKCHIFSVVYELPKIDKLLKNYYTK